MTTTHSQGGDWQAFLDHYREIRDLNNIESVLGWDQSTYLPEAAAEGRGRQQALLSRLAHAHATDADYGRLLERLGNRGDLGPEQERTLALARKAFGRSTRLPERLVGEMSEHWGRTYTAWTKARPANDWAGMIPLLEKSLDLTLEAAGHEDFANPHDAYIDQSDEGMSADQIAQIFGDLQRELVPLVEAVTAAQAAEDASRQLSRGPFGLAQQLAFGEEVIRDYGYDFSRGRQDLTHHPFMSRLGDRDVRITTRYREDDPMDALYSTLHESGHAMYEMGIQDAYLGTPLGGGVSSGVHESQSRLWENLVGRSRAFWTAYGGDFRAAFPEQLRGVSDEDLYRASNAVSRSLIRTDADELTYNLHVMLRFGLERELLAGRLAVRDLADAWQSAYQDNLGVQSPDLKDGVLQDVHWFFGPVAGAFQGYTLGNIMGGQFFAAARQALPELDDQIARREFGPLHGWLRENIYQHGRRYTPNELVQRVTGSDLSAGPYLEYLRGKYSDLYGVQL